MNEHQRRVWHRMIEAIDTYKAGDLELGKLCSDLKGLLGASDLHDLRLVSEFWNHFAEIDMEDELRTEAWGSPDMASEERLRDAVTVTRRGSKTSSRLRTTTGHKHPGSADPG